MRTCRLLLHVMLSGVYVFLTSVTVLAQLTSSDLSWSGMSVLVLLGAWAGASSTLRTTTSLATAAVGATLQLALAASGHFFNHFVGLWVALIMTPLAFSLIGLVGWRKWADDAPGPARIAPRH